MNLGSFLSQTIVLIFSPMEDTIETILKGAEKLNRIDGLFLLR